MKLANIAESFLNFLRLNAFYIHSITLSNLFGTFENVFTEGQWETQNVSFQWASKYRLQLITFSLFQQRADGPDICFSISIRN